MNLLFDQNLSPQLVKTLSDIFPDSEHVSNIGLGNADDKSIWDYALSRGFTIVTKDVDFSDLSLIYGSPPKTILIKRGNCSTKEIEMILRSNSDSLKKFLKDKSSHIFLLV